MKLTDELYKIGCEKYMRKTCIFIDDSHTMLIERTVVTDEMISDFVKRIKKAREAGINVSTIIDFRLVPNTSYIDKGGNRDYSVGVFLVDRAKGSTLELKCFDLDYVLSKDIHSEVSKYLKFSELYIEELEKRANAPQEMFDKLVYDCLELNKFGLEIDPKPTNYFFDISNGFTITNVRNKTDNKYYRFCKSFVTYIHYIVYGYGKPVISIGNEFYNKLPEEYVLRLINVYKIIDEKIKLALINNDIDKSIIEVAFMACDKKYIVGADIMDSVNIEKEIEELRKQNELKRK